MNDNVKDAVLAIGAACELAGEMVRQLTKNGFTRKEATQIVGAFICNILTPNKTKEDN